ncbi:MAG: cysteine desulfurase [Deltaproteobacteria bacterium]|nr:cysteine desulfurase [Deltaproteobacteria bacterium]
MNVPSPESAPLAGIIDAATHIPQLGSRALFPTLRASVYANHAAVSPASTLVQHAVRAFLEDSACLGLGAVMPWIGQRDRLKQRLATLVGAEARDLALTAGTSSGILNVAMGHPWRAGDGIVLVRGEFPANVTPWLHAARLFDLHVHWVDVAAFESTSGDGLAQVEAALNAGARLVAVSAVQFQTGFRMPIEALGALCRKHQAAIFVDAIQACGATPIDVSAVDYLACGGHKWLMGLEGVGFLYVAPHRVKQLRPHLTSWLSHQDGMEFLFAGPGHLRYDRPIRQSADMFEASAPQVALFAALEAGIATVQAIGLDAVFRHIQAWHDHLEPRMVSLGFASLRSQNPVGRSASLCFDVPSGVDVVALHAALDEHGISVAIPDGRLRFSPHWPNALSEPDTIVDVLDGLIPRLQAGRGN